VGQQKALLANLLIFYGFLALNGAQGRIRTTDTAIFSRILIIINQCVAQIGAVNVASVEKGFQANCQHAEERALCRSEDSDL
jgi:hypothetical protein